MAEDQFQAAAREPRFRGSRYPTGVSGATVGGVQQVPTAAEVSGINGNPQSGTAPVATPSASNYGKLLKAQTPAESLARYDPVTRFGQKYDPIGTGAINAAASFAKKCFLTEAVMAATGGGDDAPELEIMRRYRDQVLMRSPQGQQLVQEYEDMAPGIVEDISMMPNAQELFAQLYQQFIVPIVQAIQSGDHQTALQMYAKMVASAQSMADDAMMKVGYGDVDTGMEGDASDPAAVSYDGLNAIEATAGPGGMQQGQGATPWTPTRSNGMPSAQSPMGHAAIAMGGMQGIPPPANQDMPDDAGAEPYDPNYPDEQESTPNPATRNRAIMGVY